MQDWWQSQRQSKIAAILTDGGHLLLTYNYEKTIINLPAPASR